MTGSTRRWRPLSSLDIHGLSKKLQHRTDAWLAEWLPEAKSCRVRSSCCTDELPKGDATVTSPWMKVQIHDDALESLTARALTFPHLGQDTRHHFPIAWFDHVRTQIICSLQEEVCFENDQPKVDLPPSPTWSSCTCFEIEVPEIGLLLTLHVTDEYFLIPIDFSSSTSRPAHANTPHSAIQEGYVSVRVSLGSSRLRACELLEIAVGDVLKLPNQPTQPLELHLEQCERKLPPFAHGVLGLVGSHLAVQLTNLESPSP